MNTLNEITGLTFPALIFALSLIVGVVGLIIFDVILIRGALRHSVADPEELAYKSFNENKSKKEFKAN